MSKAVCFEFVRCFERQRARAAVVARFGSSVARGGFGSGRGALAARALCRSRGSAPDRRARFTRKHSLCLQRGPIRRPVPSASNESNTSSSRSVSFGPHRAAAEFSARSGAAPRGVASVPSCLRGRALASPPARVSAPVPRYPHTQMLTVPASRSIPTIRSLGCLSAPLRVAPWPNPSLKRTCLRQAA
jgi:hypothetical protein